MVLENLDHGSKAILAPITFLGIAVPNPRDCAARG